MYCLPDIHHIVAAHRLCHLYPNILCMQRCIAEVRGRIPPTGENTRTCIKSRREYERRAPVPLLLRFPNLLLLLRIAHDRQQPCIPRIPILIINLLHYPERRRDACEHDVDDVSGAEVWR